MDDFGIVYHTIKNPNLMFLIIISGKKKMPIFIKNCIKL